MQDTYYYGTQVKSYSMSKVFGWMFYAILLTAITSIGLPYILYTTASEYLYNGFLIGGLIATFVLTFIGQFVMLRTKSKVLAITIFSLFAISMGIWISPLILMYDLNVIGTSLLVTSGIFGIMAIYGAITKRDLTGFGNTLFMLLVGALFVSIINIFIASTTVDWILSYVLLGVYIGFIAYDVQKVKQIAESGQLTTNVSLLMALNLYLDFVYIFVKLVQIIGNRD